MKKPETILGINKDVAADFTPDGDGVNDTLKINFNKKLLSEPAESWQLDIKDDHGSPVRTTGESGDVPKTIEWDGLDADGKPVASSTEYTATLSVTPSEKDKATLQTDKIEASQTVKTGVILEKVGENMWRINVPSFSFDPNAATFNNLTRAQRKDLENTLSDVVQKIKTIEGGIVTVEAYANNVSNTQKEQVEELLPLSQKRAEVIAAMIIERGIAKEDVRAAGRGGENPIAAWEDRANWWKNRRIEFVIRK